MNKLETPFFDNEIEGLEEWIEHTEAITTDGVAETRKMLKEYRTIKEQLQRHEEAMKEAVKLLRVARCHDSRCDNNGTIAVQISEDEWEPQRCQWCDERKSLIENYESDER